MSKYRKLTDEEVAAAKVESRSAGMEMRSRFAAIEHPPVEFIDRCDRCGVAGDTYGFGSFAYCMACHPYADGARLKKEIDEKDAEIARLRAELAAAIRERDTRTMPSSATLEFIRCRIESYEAFGPDDAKRWRDAIDWVCDAEDALRAHAARAGKDGE